MRESPITSGKDRRQLGNYTRVVVDKRWMTEVGALGTPYSGPINDQDDDRWTGGVLQWLMPALLVLLLVSSFFAARQLGVALFLVGVAASVWWRGRSARV